MIFIFQYVDETKVPHSPLDQREDFILHPCLRAGDGWAEKIFVAKGEGSWFRSAGSIPPVRAVIPLRGDCILRNIITRVVPRRFSSLILGAFFYFLGTN
jgi:hypothetical protein